VGYTGRFRARQHGVTIAIERRVAEVAMGID
jgi:hypothetical protein